MAMCGPHNWTKKNLACPWPLCPRGARGLWTATGKQKKTVYVRYRVKDELGSHYAWERTKLDASELYALEVDDEDELVF